MDIIDVRNSKEPISGNPEMILSRHLGSKHGNTLVSGRSASGKSYHFLRPNILLANSVYVVTVVKNVLKGQTEQALLEQGYTSVTLDLAEPQSSVKYDPMKYATEESLSDLAKIMVDDFFLPEDTYWNDLAYDILKMLLTHLYKAKKPFCELPEYLKQLHLNESTILSEMLQEAELSVFVAIAPQNTRLKCYLHLYSMFTDTILSVTSGEDTLHLDRIGDDEKKVYYLNHSMVDRSNHWLSDIFLYQAASLHPDKKFKNHVTFVLDEFPNVGMRALLPTGNLESLENKNASAIVSIQTIEQIPAEQRDSFENLFSNVVLLASSPKDYAYWLKKCPKSIPDRPKAEEGVILTAGAPYLDKTI